MKIPARIEFGLTIARKGRNGILANYMGRRSNFQAAMRSANNACSDILEEDSSNISTNQVRQISQTPSPPSKRNCFNPILLFLFFLL